jgi:hypothetical protein
MKHLRLAVIACSILGLVIPAACGQEASAPGGGEGKPAKAAGAKAAGKKATGKTAAAGTTIDWDGKPLDATKAANRLRLLKQVNKWDRVEVLARKCIEAGEPKFMSRGFFYMAMIQAQAGKLDEAMESVRKAVENGFKNAADFDSVEFSALQEREDFNKLISDLTKQLEKEMREKFRAEVDAAFKAREGAPTWAPKLIVSDEAAWAPGQPWIGLLTRVHHDGLPKALAALKAYEESKAKKVPVRLLFYQYDLSDGPRVQQTSLYAKDLALEFKLGYPHAVMGRESYKSLLDLVAPPPKAGKAGGDGEGEEEGTLPRMVNYFPVMVFFDKAGIPVFALDGVPADWQLDYALAKFAEVFPPPPPPPPPKEEPKAEPKAEETPQPTPGETPQPTPGETPQPTPGETPKPSDAPKAPDAPPPSDAPKPE